MSKVKKAAKIWLCISIVVMLLSMIVCSAVQTNGGSVTIKQLNVETDDGWTMSCNLYIPANATAETPAPAVVTSHGSLNNKEMQDANCVELARRGYVVLAEDMSSHGNSEITSALSYGGVYQGAQLLSRLNFVDATRIGITGHSAGGGSCNTAVRNDNAAENQVVASVLLNCCDATYQDGDGNWFNMYGSRDVGIIACQYDEFFHTQTLEDGSKLPAYFFMNDDNPKPQSFLYFGEDPTGLELRKADTYYTQDVDGEEAVRVIFRPDIIHPWSHFSAKSTALTIEYFEKTLGAPNPIAASSQVWQWKEAFNGIGLLGLCAFIVSFTTLMVYTPSFESLRAEELAKPVPVTDKAGKLWFWCGLIAAALNASLIYLSVLKSGTAAKFVRQTESYGLGCWSAACGVFSILCMILSYRCYGKKNGMDLVERGVKIGAKKLGKTVLLAVIVAAVSYAWVFFADYFFKTDFRFWTLAMKTFTADKLGIAVFPYLELFLVFYIAASVSANCFNYNTIGGKKGIGNVIIVAIFTAFPALVLPWIQYISYYRTGFMAWGWTTAIYPMWVLWLFPIVLILIAATVISRLIYKVTKNPYLAGIINGIIVTVLTCTNTSTKIL